MHSPGGVGGGAVRLHGLAQDGLQLLAALVLAHRLLQVHEAGVSARNPPSTHLDAFTEGVVAVQLAQLVVVAVVVLGAAGVDPA